MTIFCFEAADGRFVTIEETDEAAAAHALLARDRTLTRLSLIARGPDLTPAKAGRYV